METTLVITQLDQATLAWMAQEAERTGLSLETVARRLIYRGLEVETVKPEIHHDLDHLAGTWSAEEADEFRRAIAEMEQVDSSLWQYDHHFHAIDSLVVGATPTDLLLG